MISPLTREEQYAMSRVLAFFTKQARIRPWHWKPLMKFGRRACNAVLNYDEWKQERVDDIGAPPA